MVIIIFLSIFIFVSFHIQSQGRYSPKENLLESHALHHVAGLFSTVSQGGSQGDATSHQTCHRTPSGIDLELS